MRLYRYSSPEVDISLLYFFSSHIPHTLSRSLAVQLDMAVPEMSAATTKAYAKNIYIYNVYIYIYVINIYKNPIIYIYIYELYIIYIIYIYLGLSCCGGATVVIVENIFLRRNQSCRLVCEDYE